MKRKFIPTWLFAFVLLAAATSASAQQSATTNVPPSKAKVQKEQASQTRAARLQQNRPVVDIEADIKDVNAKIEAKKKIEGYDLKALQQRLAVLQEELKKAKSTQR